MWESENQDESPLMTTDNFHGIDRLVELARMCARNARITTSRDVADELWRMAKEYQAQAAEMGDFPEIASAAHRIPRLHE